MRSAVIGAGVSGSIHVQVLEGRGTLCAVCDTDTEKLKRFSGVPVYTDYKKMIEEAKPDCVHICTPHYLHAEMVVYALEKGVHVLCEKPLCITKEQINAILEAEKRSTATLGVCFQNRYNKENVFVKEYLKDRRVVCAVGQVSWHRTKEYYATGDWRGKYATEGGGVLINQALHTLDILQYFAGMPDKIVSNVCNLTLKDSVEVEDTAVIHGVSGAGITLFASNGSRADMPVTVTVRTEDELIYVIPGHVFINGVPQKLEETYARRLGKECYGSGHELLISDFYSCLEEGRRFPIDGEEAAKAVRLVLAAYRSGGGTAEV